MSNVEIIKEYNDIRIQFRKLEDLLYCGNGYEYLDPNEMDSTRIDDKIKSFKNKIIRLRKAASEFLNETDKYVQKIEQLEKERTKEKDNYDIQYPEILEYVRAAREHGSTWIRIGDIGKRGERIDINDFLECLLFNKPLTTQSVIYACSRAYSYNPWDRERRIVETYKCTTSIIIPIEAIQAFSIGQSLREEYGGLKNPYYNANCDCKISLDGKFKKM